MALISGLVPGLSSAQLAALQTGLIVPVLLTENNNNTDTNSFSGATGPASITPPASTLILAAFTSSHATAAETPNSVTGNGLTWNLVTNSGISNAGSTRRTSWFYTFGASPTAGAPAIGFAGTMTGCGWAFFAVPNAALVAPVQAVTATANSTTITNTLAALAHPNNAHFYALSRIVAELSNPPAVGGWTELADRTWTSPTSAQQVAYAIGDVSADPTWPTSGQVAISSIEVRAR